ncbi:hypothetical protein CFOL_v3_11990 [Cephalotus follicularis]|uniref:Uncharacterized protein n=1 Tax=Cephalotus follicularis TaxID=3775 RepID=A0A1Q3BKE4_CEPFO|nr:hypothetical protein CFOL_v3_11990 [Cephalotus follicularis]
MFLAEIGLLFTIPVLRSIVTFSIKAWIRSILSKVCSTGNMFGATITIAFPSSSSHAFTACKLLNPGTLNHLIWDSSLAERGMMPSLGVLVGSAPTGDPPFIISMGFMPICMSAKIAYFLVIAKSWMKDGRAMENMGTSHFLFPLASKWK